MNSKRCVRGTIRLFSVFLIGVVISGVAAGDAKVAGNIWVATDDRIALVAPNGNTLFSASSAFGRRFRYGVGVRHIEGDHNDGGLWVTDVNNDRVLKFSRTAVAQFEIPVFSPTGIAFDPSDGGVWVSVLSPSISDRTIVKLDRHGHEVARVTGFSVSVSQIAAEAAPAGIWVSDRFNNEVVRLTGTPGELNGYDASGSFGARHFRIGGIEEAFSVVLADRFDKDANQAADAWAANRFPGQVVKLTPAGTELVRRAPSLAHEVRLVTADPRNGGVWAVARNGNPNEGMVRFSSTGKELLAVPFPFIVAFDLDWAYNVAWAGVGLADIAPDDPPQVVAMNSRGRELLRFDESSTVRDIVVQRLTVAVDIRPQSTLNVIRPTSKGTVAVAVLSDADFDALQVRPDTARFGRRAAKALSYRVKDVDRDGDADLVLHFNVKHTGIACDDKVAPLSALTYEPIMVSQRGSILTRGCKRQVRASDDGDDLPEDDRTLPIAE